MRVTAPLPMRVTSTLAWRVTTNRNAAKLSASRSPAARAGTPSGWDGGNNKDIDGNNNKDDGDHNKFKMTGTITLTAMAMTIRAMLFVYMNGADAGTQKINIAFLSLDTALLPHKRYGANR